MSYSGTFVPLDTAIHDRDSFHCAKKQLSKFLREDARRCQEAGISRTLVLPGSAPLENEKLPILAFYTVAPTSLKRQDGLPLDLAGNIPAYPVPLFLIAQLAVDANMAGQGLGGVTLQNALKYLWAVSQTMPARAIVVDCVDDEAQSFYKHFGFETLCNINGRPRLFLPMTTVERLFEK